MTTRDAIGWVGAGKMGQPMTRHLMKAGHRVTVVEPDAANRAAAAAAGATICADLGALARAARIIFTMIPNDATLDAIVTGANGLAAEMQDGDILIDMSTVSPRASARAAKTCRARGIAFLRAPVSGSTATAEQASLSVLVSGPRAAFERAEPLLAAFSKTRLYLGDGEQARYLKIVLNTLVGGTAAIVAEALALGREGGLDNATMMDAIAKSAVASPLLGYKRDMVVSGDYAPAFSVLQMIKDLDIILSTADADGVAMPVARDARRLYADAVQAGLGARDFFVIAREGKRGGAE